MTSACMTYAGGDLPPIIQRAITRASDPTILNTLSLQQRWAMCVLLRRVSADDGADRFWVKRSNFAALLNISEPTVYRILAALERAQLIVREAQKRTKGGGFAVAQMRLTDAAAALLGLTKARAQDGDESLYRYSSARRRSMVIDNNQAVKNLQSLEKHPQAGPAETLSRKNEAAVRTHKVPEDLTLLHLRGLQPKQIFKLMALATARQKRLGDVVAVMAGYLGKLSGRALFAYVVRLLSVDKDYAYLRRQAAEADQEKARQQDEVEAIDAARARGRNTWFKGADRLFRVHDNGAVECYCLLEDRKESIGWLAGESERGFWKRVITGEFARCLSVPAG